MWCLSLVRLHPVTVYRTVFGVRYSGVVCHYIVFFTDIDITISALFYHHNYYYCWCDYVHGHCFWVRDFDFLKLSIFGSAIAHFLRCFFHKTYFFFRILDSILLESSGSFEWNLYHQLEYFTWLLQALQLIVLAVCRDMTSYSCMLVNLW